MANFTDEPSPFKPYEQPNRNQSYSDQSYREYYPNPAQESPYSVQKTTSNQVKERASSRREDQKNSHSQSNQRPDSKLS